MQRHKILQKTNKTILFEGAFPNYKTCVEYAVRDNVKLADADLSGLNLSNAELDGATLSGADFTGTNLGGANLSEALLERAVFSNANLVDSCLNESRIARCDLGHARFGATDIIGTDLSACTFSDLSCFSLDFIRAQSLGGSIYIHFNNGRYAMNYPPKVVRNLLHTIIAILDTHLLVTDYALPLERLNAADFIEMLLKRNMQNKY